MTVFGDWFFTRQLEGLDVKASHGLDKKEDFATWLDPEEKDNSKLRSILEIYQGQDLEMDPVSTEVNNPQNEGPELLKPIESARKGI